MFCKNCGSEVPAGQSFCANCGAPVAATPAAPAGEYLGGKDKLTMALICFFLGGLGVHNFMMGESKKGILRLVLSLCGLGLGGILALIDFIKILMDKYEVNPEAFI